jgi:hypothetical protein
MPYPKGAFTSKPNLAIPPKLGSSGGGGLAARVAQVQNNHLANKMPSGSKPLFSPAGIVKPNHQILPSGHIQSNFHTTTLFPHLSQQTHIGVQKSSAIGSANRTGQVGQLDVPSRTNWNGYAKRNGLKPGTMSYELGKPEGEGHDRYEGTEPAYGANEVFSGGGAGAMNEAAGTAGELGAEEAYNTWR